MVAGIHPSVGTNESHRGSWKFPPPKIDGFRVPVSTSKPEGWLDVRRTGFVGKAKGRKQSDIAFMNPPQLKSIRRVLAIGPVQIKVPWTPYHPHWRRSGQTVSNLSHSLGAQIKQQRLTLRLFQADLAKRLGVSVVSISNWERGVSQPSRRFRRRIRAFLAQSFGTRLEK